MKIRYELENSPEGQIAERVHAVILAFIKRYEGRIHPAIPNVQDIAEGISLDVSCVIAEAELAILKKYSDFALPDFGMATMEQIKFLNQLRLLIAKRDHPEK